MQADIPLPLPVPVPTAWCMAAVQLHKASLRVPVEAAARTGATSTCAAQTAGVSVPHVAIVLLRRRLPAVRAGPHAVPDDRLR